MKNFGTRMFGSRNIDSTPRGTSMASLPRKFSPILTWLAAAALLLLHYLIALESKREQGTTSDELVHLTGGFSYWQFHDYRLHPENGILPQRWAALPTYLEGATFPSLDQPAWRKSDVWGIGYQFFYELGEDHFPRLMAGRAMIALFSVATGTLIFAWSRALFGTTAGFISLALFVFCPTFLAHGGLVTSDMAAALGFLAATLTWWRLCHRVSLGRVLAAGGALGLLATAKFSSALFAPMGVIIVGLRLLRSAPLPMAIGRMRWRVRGVHRWTVLGGGAALAGGCAVAIIWTAYGFRFSASPHGRPAEFTKSWEDVLLVAALPDFQLADGRSAIDENADLKPGAVQAFVSFAREHRLLPEAYLYGLAFVDRHARARLAYFAGEYRATGWWSFFPTVFALKTTLPALGCFGLALLFWIRLRRARSRLLYRAAPLLVFLTIYWLFSIGSSLNIGHRHLLPVYPAFYVLAGVLGVKNRRRLWPAAAIIALLGWHAAESFWIRPHYLAYFNQLNGGPKHAHRMFVDSSLDWGQDLPGLKRWLETNARNEPIFLSYFGSDSPRHYQIKATRIGDSYFDAEPRRALPRMTGGVYCISATMLHRVYTHVRGPWSADYDRAYWEATRWLKHVSERPKGSPAIDLNDALLSDAELQRRLVLLEQMRFARLCHFLSRREPMAHVGYSILIFRLTDQEVTFTLQASLEELNASVTQ